MALAPFHTYCAEDSDRFEVKRWLLPAIVFSLVFHAGLLVAFQHKRVESFPVVQAPPRQPAMVLWRLKEPPKFPEEEEGKLAPMPVPAAVVQPLPTPVDRPGDLAGDVTSQVVGPALPLASTPSGNEGTCENLQRGIPGDSSAAVRWNTLMNGLATSGGRESNLPMAKGPVELSATMGAKAPLSVAGRRTLDEALSRLEPVAVGDAPIDISGGALFEYDSYELRPEAMEQLRKLGELIHRNPHAVFSIEGHTDSIGSVEYNQALSEKRATAVKEWLVQYMGIAPERVETRGLGSSRLLVPGTGTMEEQQPNRRVEIVIKSR